MLLQRNELLADSIDSQIQVRGIRSSLEPRIYARRCDMSEFQQVGNSLMELQIGLSIFTDSVERDVLTKPTSNDVGVYSGCVKPDNLFELSFSIRNRGFVFLNRASSLLEFCNFRFAFSSSIAIRFTSWRALISVA